MARATSFFQFKKGDHICVFYEDEEALSQVLTPYIVQGLRNGERCFCVQKDETVRRLHYELRFLGIDIDKEIERGALEFHNERDIYFQNGKFEPAAMMELLAGSIESSAKQGFTAFRTAGELTWAASGGPHQCDQLLEYEKLVEEYYPGQPAIGICQYLISAFPPDVLEGVLDAHRQSLKKPTQGSKYISLKIAHGYRHADITANLRNPSEAQYYYVVREQLQNDFLGWGTENSLDDATQRVEELLGGRSKGLTAAVPYQ